VKFAAKFTAELVTKFTAELVTKFAAELVTKFAALSGARAARRPGSGFMLLCGLGSGVFGMNQAQGAACCGKSSAAPFLMVGDDQTQLSLGVALGNVVAQIADDGVPNFGSSQNSETSQTYKLDLATLLSDRMQGGLSVPVTTYSVLRGGSAGGASTGSGISESSTGLGDLRLSLGYEVLPAWSYSSWKPQGFLFSALTLPTGRSYDGSSRTLATDVTGAGYFSWTVGALLLKKWTVWDAFLVPEIHYALPRTLWEREAAIGGGVAIGGDKRGDGRGDRGAATGPARGLETGTALRLSPGFGGSLGVGFGFSPRSGQLRLGFRLQPRVEQGVQVSAPAAGGGTLGSARDYVTSTGVSVATCDTGIDVSYMMSSVDSVSVSYVDQTLLGPALNSGLSRSLGIGFQHRWER